MRKSISITRPNLEISGDEDARGDSLDDALFMHTLLNSKYHDAAVSCLIALDACLQIADEGKGYTLGSYVTHVVIQALLFIDLGSFSASARTLPSHIPYSLSLTYDPHIISHSTLSSHTPSHRSHTLSSFTYPLIVHIPSHRLDVGLRLYDTDGQKRKSFLTNFWNIFDFAIGVILFVTMGMDDHAWLRFLRIVRLSRIMKMYSTTFGDLLVILNSLSNSFICVLYVLALLSLFFLLFAIAGVLLFKHANPYYFGTVVSSLKTLLQGTSPPPPLPTPHPSPHPYPSLPTSLAPYQRPCHCANVTVTVPTSLSLCPSPTLL